MAQETRSQIDTYVDATFYTNTARLIDGNEVNAGCKKLNASMVNAIDDADVAGGYMKISSLGRVNVSFINSPVASGLFLRDDGTWSSVSGAVAWGGITGTLSAQADLQTALNARLLTSQLDNDPTLAGNSAIAVPSQQAVKAFITAAAAGVGLTSVLTADNTTSGKNILLTDNDYLLVGTDSSRLIGCSTFTVNKGILFSNSNSGESMNFRDIGGFEINSDILTPDNNSHYFGASGGQIKYVAGGGGSFQIKNVNSAEYFKFPDGGGIEVQGTLRFPSLIANQLPWLNASKNIADSTISADGNNLFFATGYGVDSVATGGTDSLNIGVNNADVINIGTGTNVKIINFGSQATHLDQINLYGTIVRQDVTNLAVTDKLITVNVNGAAASGAGSGFEVEENSVITGYFKINGTRDGFDMLSPAISFKSNLSLASLTANRTHTLPNVTGTLISTGDTGTVTNTMLAGSIVYPKLILTNSIVSGDIVSLVWSKITGTPTTFSGYGISDTTSNLPEGSNLYFTNARAIAAPLTGYSSGAGTVSATDSILQAIQKLNGNISALTTGVSSVNGGTGAVTITVTGTSNRITVTGGTGLTPTIDISASYVGQSSITTLGTIGTGTWQGTAVADGYISSATNWNTAYTNRITSLTVTGSSGAATLSSNVLNIPTYTLSGLGGTTLAAVNAQNLSVFAATTSAQLASIISDETGSGVLVFGTAPVFTTSITAPLIYGGSAVGSQLNLQGTSANGTSAVAAVNILVGNNGGTTALGAYNTGNLRTAGNLTLGNAGVEPLFKIHIITTTNGDFDSSMVFQNTSTGSTATDGTIMGLANGVDFYFKNQEATGRVIFKVNGSDRLAIAADGSVGLAGANTNATTMAGSQLALRTLASTGAVTGFNYTAPANTTQTTGVAIPQVLYTLANTQHAQGNIAGTYGFVSYTQPTLSFLTSSSTATLTGTVTIDGAPNSGTNAIQTTAVALLIKSAAVNGTGTVGTSYGAYINAQTGATTNYALGINGKTQLLDTVSIGSGASLMFWRGSTNAFSFNRNPDTGAITNSNAFAYQWGRVESTTNTADTLGLTVYNTAGTSVRSALFVDGRGYVGMGTSTPAALLHSLGTTEQLRLGYDASNYASYTVNSTGSLSVVLTGTAPTFTLGATNTIVHTSNANNTLVNTGSTSAQSSTVSGTRSINIQSYAADTNYIDAAGSTLRIRTTTANNMEFWINGSNVLSLTTGGLASFVSKITNSLPQNLKSYTVATLPAGNQGDIAYVTDALTPSFLVLVVGGGTTKAPVFYDGTQWVVF